MEIMSKIKPLMCTQAFSLRFDPVHNILDPVMLDHGPYDA